MLVDTFANRLQKAMNNCNLKQSELAEKTGLDKSLISNYLSGNYNAKQDKISILAEILNVSEAWLMGYDVPINSIEYAKLIKFNSTLFTLLNYYKISENELSQKTNINVKVLKEWKNEQKFPTNEELEKISAFFNIKNVEDLYNGNTFYEIMQKYENADKTPYDKYQFGFILEEMFENLSKDLNQPLEKLKEIFLNANGEQFDTDLALTYNNLKNFFIEYFTHSKEETLQVSDETWEESKKKLLDSDDFEFDEIEKFFSKNKDKLKDVLTEDDKEMLTFILKKRFREIDKQLDSQLENK